MTEERLVARGIVKRYGAATVLHSVTLTLRAGEVHGLLGHNGAGKSTLLKILAGAVAPDGGEILLDGRQVSFASPAAASYAGIAARLPGAVTTGESATVTQNLFLAREVATSGVLNKKAMQAEARRQLEPMVSTLAVTRRSRICRLRSGR